MMVALIFGVFALCIVLGFPVALSLASGALIPLVALTDLPITLIPQRLFTAVDTYALMAIPFFVIAGGFMDKGGVSSRLVKLADSLVGWLPGSMAVVTFFASAFFGAISGSAPATVVAIGGIMLPAMLKEGYPKGFALATVGAAGILGVIVPPSITYVVYGMATGTSIGDMLLAGFVPGFVLCFGMAIYAVYFGITKMKHVKRTPFQLKNVWAALKEAIWAVLMPVIILGGIYGGVFTPTEAAAVTIAYGAIIGLFVYKELDIKKILSIMVSSVKTSAMIMFIVATASAFSYMMTMAQIPNKIANFIISISSNQFIFFSLVLALLLVVGCIMDTTPAILILAPILLPVAKQLGIDPVAFGIIMCIALAIGLVTPPVGVNLYVAVSLDKEPIKSILNKHLFIYIILATLVVVLLMCFQNIITFII